MSTEPHPDEVAAALNADVDDPATLTRRWLLTNHVATLCTTAVHREVAGFPYGSVVPFALDPTGRPIVLIASIAAHTKNLVADPRGSLFVRQPNTQGDPQAGWRVTLMGRFTKVPRSDPDRPALHARYLQRVPDAAGYDRMHDFDYWRMSEVVKVRYIGGFGKIRWMDGPAILTAPEPTWPEAAAGAVAHMNEDHAHNLIEMCEGHYGVRPAEASMVDLHPDGFVVRTSGPDHTLFFPFGKPIGGEDIRMAVIDVLKQSRRRLADGSASRLVEHE